MFVFDTPVSMKHPEIDIRIHDLSSLGQTDHALSENLSPRQSVATVQAQKKIERNFAAIRHALYSEFELHLLLNRLGIKKLPATVIDDEIVIYGELSFEEIIDAWRTNRD